MTTPLETLQHYWHYDSFRPLQGEIIQSVLDGNDTLALLPTGGGKSICYEVPALYMKRLCLVVSPLIALMKDQVEGLKQKGIRAECITSSINSNQQLIILNNCIHGMVKILYVSPERLRQRVFIEHLRQMDVGLLAVDEAHCISQWGYDFRPSYLEIANIRSYLPQVPLLALTATATPKVVADIKERLLMKKCQQFQGSFARENLSYMVFHEQDKRGRLLRIIHNTPGSGIIYVNKRSTAQSLASFLQAQKIPTTFYHAGLTSEERDQRQRQWTNGQVSIMVATNAFGMGIDKPDVRFVVHTDIPDSIESYFQEAGRAGRDGKPSYAVLLYNQDDLENLDTNFERKYPVVRYIQNVYSAICNFYQIPIGSGEGTQFPFDIAQICTNYNFNPADFYNAAAILEREGLIDIPNQEEAVSRLHIPASKEDLYRFQMNNKVYGDLVELLCRTYGGLFSDYVPIYEKVIAKKTGFDAEKIAKMLLHLDALKIVSYIPKIEGPKIIFTSPRVDEKGIALNHQNYAQLKQQAAQRREAMKAYITNSTDCRSTQLLKYFGETDSTSCGKCDTCIIVRKQEKEEKKKRELLKHKIIEQLKGQSLTPDELARLLVSDTPTHEDQLFSIDDLSTVLRQMLDQDILRMDKQFKLKVK